MLPIGDVNPRRRFPVVTVTIIIINFLVFLYQILLSDPALERFVLSAGMVPSRGKSSIAAEAATAADAVLLGVTLGEPMLVERRLIFDQRGRPIERTESRYAADRYGLNVGFSVEDSGAVTVSPEA